MSKIVRTIYSYDIVGYDDYFISVLPDLQEIISQAIPVENYFIIAVNEAVCNAAKYSIYGHEEAKINIEIVVTPEDITVTVASKTKPFDAIKYRDDLKKLEKDSAYKDMPWSEYTGLSVRSRGFWMMLTAVDYLYVDANGDKISLNLSLPYKSEETLRTIGELVPRFFVEKDGVIT